jgi:hypothetical protein
MGFNDDGWADSPNIKQNLEKRFSQTIDKAQSDMVHGRHPAYIEYGSIDSLAGGNSPSLVGTGASIFLDQNHANSITPDTRNIVTMSPEATILVKKKVFSSLRSANDLKFMDKTEKMLLRATKALFAYKVQQIRAYEALTKFENFFSETGQYSLNLLSSVLRETSRLDLSKLGYTESEYVEKRLNAWYSEKISVYRAHPQGNWIIGPENNSYVTEIKPVGVPGGTGFEVSVDPTDAVSSSDGVERHVMTNLAHLKTLSASSAKDIIKKKKANFKADYKNIDKPYDIEGESEKKLDDKIGDVTDFVDFFEDFGTVLSAGAGLENYDSINEDISKLIKRNAFSADNQLTTWIVDPDSPENYTLGPGTGVIEVALFKNFNTTTNYSTSPSGASFSLTYPYRLGTVLEDDIEMAINEALEGTVGIFQNMLGGGLKDNDLSGQTPPMDGSSVISAALEMSGLGGADSSLDMDYVRERLRTFYLGKSFINPPDPVHFYIRGNRALVDNTGVGGSAVEPSGFDEEYLEIDEAILKAEYQLYTSQAVSFDLFKEIRKRQDNSFGMVHVFGGFVSSVTEAFSGGFWDLTVSVTDNMSWLEWSQFAISPSLSDPKNILEDPLTPYSMVKDELGQIVPSERDLLHENKELLQTGLLSYHSGLFAGQSAREGNLLQGQFEGVGSLSGKKILQHADGFVYRWKTGIITATAGFQTVDPTGSHASASKQHSVNYQPTVAPDVLNNLDVPNILSILIVGQPYNIETFIEQSFAAHNKGAKSSSTSPEDPLAGVIGAVRKQNEYFGNFHPYRTNTMSPESAERMINTAGIRQSANNTVKRLRGRKLAINKKIRALLKSTKANHKSQLGNIPPKALLLTLQAEVDTIDAAINNQVNVGANATMAISSADKVGIEIGLFGSSGLPISGDFDENQEINRAMMLVGAQRRIEDVRLNRDRNLLVISDQYDTADIRPFILAMGSGKWNLFNSGYSNVLQKCHQATSILNLEFFCNSQGHLEFRPPQWNKTPLTVLKEAIRSQKEDGRTVIPSFITNLFQTRIDSLRVEIYTLNVQIVLISLMMGRFPDSTLIPNMVIAGESSLAFFGISRDSDDSSGSALSLNKKEYSWEAGNLTKQNNSTFGEGLKVTASFSESGNSLGGDTETILGEFDPIFQEQTGVINDVLSAIASGAGGSNLKPPAQHYAQPSRLNNLRDTFKKLYGRDPAKGLGIDLKKGFEAKDILTLGALDEGNAIEKALEDEAGLITKLRRAISKRDSYVSMLVANEKKVDELDEIEAFLSTGEESSYDIGALQKTGDKDFDDGLQDATDWLESAATNIKNTIDIVTGSASEGSVYDHLIADDTRNLLGHGSGKRFILSDELILSLSCIEQPPEFTRVDISGSAPFVAQGLNSGTDNMYFWAGATDFDLWRQYGYRATKKDLPFISDVEGQARPYAILELGLQKLKVNRANAQIVGNEFYQPGDTVYIPSKGLLYYVESVNHTFSYGQSFTTSLSLVYGHPPGNYVPGPLDVIGQELVGNFVEEPALMQRTSDSDDNYRPLTPDSTLVFPTDGAGIAELLAKSDNQVRFTNMMIDVMGSLSGTKYLLLRGFVTDEHDTDEAKKVREKMATVRSLFESPSQIAQNHAGAGALAEFALDFGSAKTTMSLGPMRLPNNLPVTPIPSGKIIEQLTYMKTAEGNSSTAGEIKCMDRRLLGALYKDDNSVDITKAAGVFPKGGPRQGSWLDIRDAIAGFNFSGSINVIEVGVINIPESIMSSEVRK